MRRKDIRVGMRVCPSGRGATKYWNCSIAGTVREIGQRYIKVEWDGFDYDPSEPTGGITPVCLSPVVDVGTPPAPASGA